MAMRKKMGKRMRLVGFIYRTRACGGRTEWCGGGEDGENRGLFVGATGKRFFALIPRRVSSLLFFTVILGNLVIKQK